MTFCTSQSRGFGLSPTVGLTAFKPFFVDLTLPYSVVRGESFRLTATIFNYLKECIWVRAGDARSRCQSLNWKRTNFPWERNEMSVSLRPYFPKPLCIVSFTPTLYHSNIPFRFRLTWLNQRSTRWNQGQTLRPPAVSVLMNQNPITGISQLSNWVREGSGRWARKAQRLRTLPFPLLYLLCFLFPLLCVCLCFSPS